jgi:WD40 repeat protein
MWSFALRCFGKMDLNNDGMWWVASLADEAAVWSLDTNELKPVYKGTAGGITTVRWNVKKAGLVALGHDDGTVTLIPTGTAKVCVCARA